MTGCRRLTCITARLPPQPLVARVRHPLCQQPAQLDVASRRGIQRQLETSGDSEIGSIHIGEMVMEGLKGLDSVAYIRFASVYKDFTEARDFEEFAGTVMEAGGK